jgi:hypothetical protein
LLLREWVLSGREHGEGGGEGGVSEVVEVEIV